MFKAARWKSEKNKIKAVFKLQFHATQVPQLGWDSLMVSLVPLEVGKPTVKSEKAAVRDGSCCWENPIYEPIKFTREPKTGKITEKIYQFIISTGSSKGGLVGEVSIDFADYAEAIKPCSVSLPLKSSNLGAVFHVTIQRIQTPADGREGEESGDAMGRSHGRTLKSQLSNCDTDESNHSNFTEDNSFHTGQAQLSLIPTRIASRHEEPNGNLKGSSSFDAISSSGSDSSSGQDTPKELGLKNGNIHQDTTSFLSPLSNKSRPQKLAVNALTNSSEDWKSNTLSPVSSALDGNIDNSTNSPEETVLKERLHASDTSIGKLKNEIFVLARQVEVSELELQTLRKQIVKESRRGQDLSREVCSLKEERDAFQRECDKLKALHQKIDYGKVSDKVQFGSEDLRSMLEVIKQELNYEKDLNANLRLQLQKTLESNSELILAVRDLDELLEQKNTEISSISVNRTAIDGNSQETNSLDLKQSACPRENWETVSKHSLEEDDEQHELEALVREHDDAKVAYSLEHKVVDLYSEIEAYRKDREDLEMQMEQLALDYEILKQQNHDISSRLEQCQLQEQLKMQYDCSASFATINELETHIEILEKELEEQAKDFEADLAAMTHARIEQEQRAIQAEEELRKTRWNNANTAERLQEEFKILSLQMASTFDANEKLAMQAVTEASEQRLQKSHLEDLLHKANDELRLVKDQYEMELKDLSNQLDLKSKQMEKLLLELKVKSKEIEDRKKSEEARNEAFSKEILTLRTEIEILMGEKSNLSEHKEELRAEIEQLKTSIEETEMLLQRASMERDELQKKVNSVKEEAEKSLGEINDMRCLKDEKETIVGILQSELETLRAQYNDLKHSLFEDELEKENLRKQVFHLRGDLRKKEDAISIIEKKLKDGSVKVTASDGTTKATPRNKKFGAAPRGIKEVTNLREKIKLLEGEIKQKEAALENSTHSFLKKEKDLCNRIEELEKGMGELSQNNPSMSEEKLQKEAKDIENVTVNIVKSKVGGIITENLLESKMEATAYMSSQNGIDEAAIESITATNKEDGLKVLSSRTSDQGDPTELLSEMVLLKEKNKSMEGELKEMQERYSEISLKFAEVEGERQQLVMTIRNLKNAMKN